MDRSFVLHLIRHAPTAGNQEKRYIGWTDEPVLPFAAAADRSVQNVWGSDLQRCRQTAAVLFPSAAYHAAAGLRECHFGEWERKTYEELKMDERYRQWIDDPATSFPPGGERLEEMQMRVDRVLQGLPQVPACTLIIHGGPIRYLLAKALGGNFRDRMVCHGYRYSLEWENRQAFEEGQPCTSFSEVPLMANGNTSAAE